MLMSLLERLLWRRSARQARDAAVECLARARTHELGGRPDEALSLGRAGLALLRDPQIRRDRTLEAATLIDLTLLVERVAEMRGGWGAAREDLSDSLAAIQRLTKDSDGAGRHPRAEEWRQAVPFLESRLQRYPER
jgi:hypothetical protein